MWPLGSAHVKRAAGQPWGSAPCAGFPLAPSKHQSSCLRGHGGAAQAMVLGLVVEDPTATNKPMKEQDPVAALSQGLRPCWCPPSWVSARAEGFASSDILPGITKATLPIARAKKVPPASGASAWPAAAVYLASMTSYHTETCSWGAQRALARLAGTSGSATPRAPLCLVLGSSTSPRLTSTWEEIIHPCFHLAAGDDRNVSCTALLKASHPTGASSEAGSVSSAPG